MKVLPFQPHRIPDERDERDELVCQCLLNNLDGLYSTAYRLSGRADIAEDMVQETARKALQAAAGLRHERNIRGWLFKILVNSVRRYFHRSKKWEELDVEQEQIEGSQDLEGISQAAVQDVRRALSQLQPSRRAVVILIEIEQFTIAEAADILKVPPGTVASRLARARGQLRDLLPAYRSNSSLDGGQP